MSGKAKESVQIQKARKKIKQQIASADKKINEGALLAMSKTIRLQISRHASERINLKEKIVTLFDENRHPAPTQNKFISKLAKQIKANPSDKNLKKLEGRIFHHQ